MSVVDEDDELLQRIFGAGPVVERERRTEAAAGLTAVDGGYAVKQLPDGRWIDLAKMLFNWRLLVVHVDEAGDRWPLRGWCYFGHGRDSEGNERSMTTAFATALAAATAWDGSDESQPELYDKRAL